MRNNDKRLIETYLPIVAISSEARQENSVTQARAYLSKALLSILHRWWARRPLSACRAAVYGTLVPAPAAGELERQAEFVERLCRWKAPLELFEEAKTNIRKAFDGRPPRVLDMFGGGGSIPLEAARLGCDAFSVELNPVAYIVELATLVYPALHRGKLADLVRQYSRIVLERVQAEVGDLYIESAGSGGSSTGHSRGTFSLQAAGDLNPTAYFWTRTVPCNNPHCKRTIPLVRQTWLRKKPGGFVAIKVIANTHSGHLEYEILSSSAHDPESAIAGWRYDPVGISSSAGAECPFCRSSVSGEYLKEAAATRAFGSELMAIAYTSDDHRGKQYVAAEGGEDSPTRLREIEERTTQLAATRGIEMLNESIEANPRSMDVQRYGLTAWSQLFLPRQLLTLLTFAAAIRDLHKELISTGTQPELATVICTYLGLGLDRVAERNWTITHWDARGEFIQVDLGSGRLPMNWDFPEANPIGSGSGSWQQALDDLGDALETLCSQPEWTCAVQRGSALNLPFNAGYFDAVITDPPYYDNVSYSNLADFFYVWLKRSIGHLYPEHFAAELTPKRQEAISAAYRLGGDAKASRSQYEEMMTQAFREAHRVLKPGAPMLCVYAHKTTAGWATLIEALRKSGFVVTEAWPFDTENPSRQTSKEQAALASSIFLVTRKRESSAAGAYEDLVRPELNAIVGERVDTLWNAGVSGADLVISCVGAGLRAFTRYAKVEYANGEEVPAERFLAEVESVVLDSILIRLSKAAGADSSRYSLVGVDPATRFYILWRYTYRSAELESGEAIVFANGTHVELDGLHGLSSGSRALVEKKKSRYRLLDYAERGDDTELGKPSEEAQPAPLIDALHRLLWLMERHPSSISEFLRKARPNTEQLRLVAQALAGPALKGGELGEVATGTELAALTKLTANWRSVVEDAAEAALGPLFRDARKNE